MQRCKGFTLIELLMAIVILIIIAAIGWVNLHAYTLNRNLRSAARDIASDFSLCKQRAVSENNTYQIVFNKAESSYAIQTVTGVPPAVTKLLSSFGSDISIISADFGAASSQTVTFNTRGTVTPLGNPAGDGVVLQNSRNSKATITVNTMGRTNVTFDIK
ncbi:MAG: prepilin-type N-terminal cleavage/methylation domain-containing protein [Deltaproteobacteria bacterium]|nr:prepilin-type N-terminal cleavage/methylation domain-containing protein [Deltaproteobacteria bacterium]